MTISTYVSQLDALTKKVESFVQSLQTSKIRPSKGQCETLRTLSEGLRDAVAAIPAEIESLKNRWAESCKEGQKFVSQAQAVRSDIIRDSHLKNSGIFARNIRLFFGGPQDSVVDSDATKARKRLTRERCERISSLTPDGLISWAITFTPSTWTANLMSNDTFDYVDEYIEPNDPVIWPSEIYRVLSALGNEEPLKGSDKYREFVEGRSSFGD